MKNTVSCGRRKYSAGGAKKRTVAGDSGERRVIHLTGNTSREKREKAVSALLLFGAMICTLWLCHFPDRRAVGTEDDRGASALSEYEVVEVFGEFGATPSSVPEKILPEDEGWTLGGYFKEFFSALLGV